MLDLNPPASIIQNQDSSKKLNFDEKSPGLKFEERKSDTSFLNKSKMDASMIVKKRKADDEISEMSSFEESKAVTILDDKDIEQMRKTGSFEKTIEETTPRQ